MVDAAPRLNMTEKIDHPALRTALLNLYTDVVEFSLRILRYIQRRSLRA